MYILSTICLKLVYRAKPLQSAEHACDSASEGDYRTLYHFNAG